MRRFFLGIFGVMFLANFLAWFGLHDVLRRLAAPEILQGCLGGFISLQAAGILLVIGGRLAGHQPGTGLGRPLLALIMIWNMLLAVPTAAVALLGDAALAMSGAAVAASATGRAWGQPLVFLPAATALVATAISLWQLGHFRIRRLKLTIPHLPPALRGVSIVHVSDLHIGKLTRGKVLTDIVAATNALDADLILMTGDLINMALEDLPQAFALVRSMKARHGVFACEGNHDLIESAAEFETAVKASGLPFLLNATATVVIKGQPVEIVGLRWAEGMERAEETKGAVPEGALHRLLEGTDPATFRILLVHHPEAFDTAVAARIPLTLAGHTHGGQLMLTPGTGFGPWLYRYWSGLYEKAGCQMVVSNGAGNWFPLRIGAPAEIIHLTLD